jgi:hypothetical protein
MTVPIEYMGHALHLRLPAITQSASLAYFARLDEFPLETPRSMREPDPMDGQTAEDIEFYNCAFRTLTPSHGPGSPSTRSCSTRHDWDWLRAVVADPIIPDSIQRYMPGILTGKWRGTSLVRPLDDWCCASNPPPFSSPIDFLTLPLGTIRS